MLPPGSSAGAGAIGGTIKSAFEEGRRSGRADEVNISLGCAYPCIALHWILNHCNHLSSSREERRKKRKSRWTDEACKTFIPGQMSHFNYYDYYDY